MESTVSGSKAVFFFAAKNIPTGTPGVDRPSVHTEVGMKKHDSKKEQGENEVEKFFNLYKKWVEWIINLQLRDLLGVY